MTRAWGSPLSSTGWKFLSPEQIILYKAAYAPQRVVRHSGQPVMTREDSVGSSHLIPNAKLPLPLIKDMPVRSPMKVS